MHRAQIYAALADLSPLAKLPHPWSHRYSPSPSFRGPIPQDDLCDLVAQLRERHSVKELLAAKVLQRKPSGGSPRDSDNVDTCFSIHPGLVLDIFLVLRKSPGDLPYDIVTRSGCLSGALPPLLIGLDDFRIRIGLKADGTLYVPATMTDVAILQRLGYAALPATGLSRLRRRSFAKFCEEFDIRRLGGSCFDGDDGEEWEECNDPLSQDPYDVPSEEVATTSNDEIDSASSDGTAESLSPPPTDASAVSRFDPEYVRKSVCLVNWHIARLTLDEPPTIGAAAARLREHAQRLDLLMDHVSISKPEAETLGRLQYAIGHGRPGDIEYIFEASQTHCRRHLVEIPCSEHPSDLSYRAIYEELCNGSDDGSFRREVFDTGIRQKVVAQMFEKAQSLDDPTAQAEAVGRAIHAHIDLRALAEVALVPPTQSSIPKRPSLIPRTEPAASRPNKSSASWGNSHDGTAKGSGQSSEVPGNKPRASAL